MESQYQRLLCVVQYAELCDTVPEGIPQEFHQNMVEVNPQSQVFVEVAVDCCSPRGCLILEDS